jgi:hypothetical protein
MTHSVFHSTSGGFDFLGLRDARGGGVEIVYDDGVARRMVWRVQGAASPGALGDALQAAVASVRVLPALYAELRRRGVAIEAIAQ